MSDAAVSKGNSKKPANTAALWIAFGVVLFDSAGIGLILPVLPRLLEQLAGSSLSEAAIIGGLLTTSYAAMQFLFGPLLGNLSDRFGRKPLLLLSIGLLAIDYVVMALAPTIWLLFVGRLIAGFAGANYTVAFAIAADVSDKENRAKNFGLMGGAFGVGFVIGPLVGGLLGSEISIRAPFWAAAAFLALSFFVALFLFRESLTVEDRRQFELQRANPLGAILQIRKLPAIRWLLLVWFLAELSEFIYPAIWGFYTPVAFGWGLREVGVSLFVFGIATAVVQGGMTGPVVARLGEQRTVAVGLGLTVFSYLAFAVITQGWMVYAAMPITMLGALFGPALMGLMSAQVDDDAQGELQGLLASLTALATIFTPLITTRIFAATTDGGGLFMPGAAFLFSAFVAIAMIWPLRAGFRHLSAGRACA